MMQMGSRYGMLTMEDSVKELVNQGAVDASELERFQSAGEKAAANAQNAAGGGAPAAAGGGPQQMGQPQQPVQRPAQQQPARRGVSSLFR
jgi:hypothetical protein